MHVTDIVAKLTMATYIQLDLLGNCDQYCRIQHIIIISL